MKHPDVIVVEEDDSGWGNDLLRCPTCGWTARLECWDVGGADKGCLFCLQCRQEVQT